MYRKEFKNADLTILIFFCPLSENKRNTRKVLNTDLNNDLNE